MNMNDIEKMMAQIDAEIKTAASDKIMSLGQIIDALGAVENKSQVCRFDFTYDGPGDLDSYRGYYDHLAFMGTRSGKTVEDVLKNAKAALGATFYGYKGGDYVMDQDTPVWYAASHSQCHDTAIVWISTNGYVTILHTAYVEL